SDQTSKQSFCRSPHCSAMPSPGMVQDSAPPRPNSRLILLLRPFPCRACTTTALIAKTPGSTVNSVDCTALTRSHWRKPSTRGPCRHNAKPLAAGSGLIPGCRSSSCQLGKEPRFAALVEEASISDHHEYAGAETCSEVQGIVSGIAPAVKNNLSGR